MPRIGPVKPSLLLLAAFATLVTALAASANAAGGAAWFRCPLNARQVSKATSAVLVRTTNNKQNCWFENDHDGNTQGLVLQFAPTTPAEIRSTLKVLKTEKGHGVTVRTIGFAKGGYAFHAPSQDGSQQAQLGFTGSQRHAWTVTITAPDGYKVSRSHMFVMLRELRAARRW